jgi:hypothetical protein
MGLFSFFNKKKLSDNVKEDDRELSIIYADREKTFFKQMDLQYPKLSTVPTKIISAYKKVLFENSDNIIKEILVAESERKDREFKILNETYGLYIFVSVLMKNKAEATKYYESISDELGFGYIQFMTEHFLNNWPDNRLSHFLHIIVLRDVKSGIFQIHNAAGDYGGSPQGKRTYMVFPTDLMNQKEISLIFKR